MPGLVGPKLKSKSLTNYVCSDKSLSSGCVAWATGAARSAQTGREVKSGLSRLGHPFVMRLTVRYGGPRSSKLAETAPGVV